MVDAIAVLFLIGTKRVSRAKDDEGLPPRQEQSDGGYQVKPGFISYPCCFAALENLGLEIRRILCMWTMRLFQMLPLLCYLDSKNDKTRPADSGITTSVRCGHGSLAKSPEKGQVAVHN